MQKVGVIPFGQHLALPPVYEGNAAFKEFMLAKCTFPLPTAAHVFFAYFAHVVVNAETACYKAPAFVNKMKATRKALFMNMIETFKK